MNQVCIPTIGQILALIVKHAEIHAWPFDLHLQLHSDENFKHCWSFDWIRRSAGGAQPIVRRVFIYLHREIVNHEKN